MHPQPLTPEPAPAPRRTMRTWLTLFAVWVIGLAVWVLYLIGIGVVLFRLMGGDAQDGR